MIVHQNQNVMDKLHVPENKNVKMAYVLTRQIAETMMTAHRQNVVKTVNVFLVTQNLQTVKGKLGALVWEMTTVESMERGDFVVLWVFVSPVEMMMSATVNKMVQCNDAGWWNVELMTTVNQMMMVVSASASFYVVVVTMSRIATSIAIRFKSI